MLVRLIRMLHVWLRYSVRPLTVIIGIVASATRHLAGSDSELRSPKALLRWSNPLWATFSQFLAYCREAHLGRINLTWLDGWS